MDDTVRFTEALLTGKPENIYVLVWCHSLQGSRSIWCQSVDEVVAAATQYNKQQYNVYIGCGWSHTSYGPHQRVKADQVAGIPGVWIDIDVLGAAHKKRRLPSTVLEACKAVAEILPVPTFIVHSGHGLHLWWLFEQPWLFTNADDREDAARLIAAWQTLLRAVFERHNWELDNTSDLARVLRIPGTYNYKVPGATVLARIEQFDGTRYIPEQLRQWLVQHAATASLPVPTKQIQHGNFVLNPNANPPMEKWEVLRESDYRVKQSWFHQRTDLHDTSMSGYDQSLASFAAHAHWSDQEIIDLLVAHRRFHKADLMLNNKQYYARTLQKARAAANTLGLSEDEQALIAKVEAQDSVDAEEPPEITEEDRRRIIELLNRRLNLGVVRLNVQNVIVRVPVLVDILCYTSDPAQYWLELYNREGEKRRVLIGDGNAVRDQKKWNRIIYDELSREMSKFSDAEWMLIRRLIAQATTRVPMGKEGTDPGRIEDYLQEYIGHRVPRIPWEKKDQYVRTETPFISRGRIYFFTAGFANWLRQKYGVIIFDRDLGIRLANAGVQKERVHYVVNEDPKHPQRSTRVIYWVEPWHDIRAEVSPNGTSAHTSADADLVEL